jgi:ABC-2 type transport system permease protein
MSKYFRILQMNIQNSMAYRVDFLTKLVSGIVPLLIQVFIWTHVYSGNNQGTIRGYTLNGIIFYSLLAIVFTKLTRCYSQHDIASEVRQGLLNQYLSKPMNHTGYWLSREIGGKILNSINLIIIAYFLSIIFKSQVGFLKAFLSCLMLVQGAMISFLIFYSLSMLSFWFIEITQIFTAFDLIFIFLSGGILPIDFFPDFVQKVLSYLPFHLIVFLPVKIFSSNVSLAFIYRNLGLQLLWIAALVLVAVFSWKKGIKQYSAFGG